MESSSDSGVRPLVLLTGATGYIGGHLLKALEKTGLAGSLSRQTS